MRKKSQLLLGLEPGNQRVAQRRAAETVWDRHPAMERITGIRLMTQTYMMCQRIDTCWMTASWMTPQNISTCMRPWMMNWLPVGQSQRTPCQSCMRSRTMDSRLVEWTGYREHPHGRTLTSPGMLNIQQSQLRNFCYRVVG